MKFIKHIFWNKEEKRLRMVWRLSLQAFILLFLLVISEIFLSLISSLLFRDPSLEKQSQFMLLLSFLVSGFLISISVWFAGHFFDRRQFSNFGFNLSASWWKDFWFGIGLGGILITGIFLLELAAGWIQPTGFLISNTPGVPFFPAILIPLLIFIMVGFYEELLSRGYQLKNLAEGLSGKKIGPRLAILLACLISSTFFGLAHVANPNATLYSTLNISLAGIFLAAGYLLTGELAIPIGLHISWNFFQGNIFGFPVSGADFRSATLIQAQQFGPDWLTGGAFGPEGGLLGILANLVGILLIILWVKKRTGKTSIHTSISKPPKPCLNDLPEKNQTNSQHGQLFLGIQHIIWDWNGTLLDDLDLCLRIINELLINRDMKTVSQKTYLDIFGFPVIDYYRKLGFDFSKEPFEDISTEFINAYEAGRPSSPLMEGSIDFLQLLYANGMSQSILSASKKPYLDQAVIDYKVQDYFILVDGLDNHHAAGKLSLAKGHLQKLTIPPHSILLIGDTLHDADIARQLDLKCCLIPKGHHSRERLENSTGMIVDSLAILKKIYLSAIE